MSTTMILPTTVTATSANTRAPGRTWSTPGYPGGLVGILFSRTTNQSSAAENDVVVDLLLVLYTSVPYIFRDLTRISVS